MSLHHYIAGPPEHTWDDEPCFAAAYRDMCACGLLGRWTLHALLTEMQSVFESTYVCEVAAQDPTADVDPKFLRAEFFRAMALALEEFEKSLETKRAAETQTRRR